MRQAFLSSYNVTLDEAGRLAIPREHRAIIAENVIYLTRGADSCLWLYTVEEWNKRLAKIRKTKPDTAKGRKIRRHYLSYVHRLVIDKQGRINIPPNLCEIASLSKDCVVKGQDNYIEIWDKERAEANECSEEEFLEISEEFACIDEDEEDDGIDAYSGAAGGDNTLSRAEGRE